MMNSENFDDGMTQVAPKGDFKELNHPELYSPCCLKSLMKPVNWKMGIIIYECVKCKFRWQINKMDLEELRLIGENAW